MLGKVESIKLLCASFYELLTLFSQERTEACLQTKANRIKETSRTIVTIARCLQRKKDVFSRNESSVKTWRMQQVNEVGCVLDGALYNMSLERG